MPDISKIRIDHLVLNDVPAHRRNEIQRVVEQAAIAAAHSPGPNTGPALEMRIGAAIRKAVNAALGGHAIAHVQQAASPLPEAGPIGEAGAATFAQSQMRGDQQ
jgi:hypothetical protein